MPAVPPTRHAAPPGRAAPTTAARRPRPPKRQTRHLVRRCAGSPAILGTRKPNRRLEGRGPGRGHSLGGGEGGTAEGTAAGRRGPPRGQPGTSRETTGAVTTKSLRPSRRLVDRVNGDTWVGVGHAEQALR